MNALELVSSEALLASWPLESLPLFHRVATADLERARQVLHAQTFPAGHTIIEAEAPGDVVFFIARGGAKVWTPHNTMLVALRGTGEIVGELSVLDGLGRSASVVTSEESVLLWASRDDFWNTLWKLEPVPFNLACLLSQRMRVLTAQAHALATLDVQGRLARQMVVLSQEYGTDIVFRAQKPGGLPVETRGREIPFRLKQEEWAGLIGGTRSQVSLLLAAWNRKKWVVRHRSRWVVLRPDMLRKLSS